MKKQSRIKGFAAFVVAVSLVVVCAPATGYADGEWVQSVRSGWTKILETTDLDHYYGWDIRVSLTVTDGIVTSVNCIGKGAEGGDIPPLEAPYFRCHEIMEAFIEAAEIPAENPSAIDNIDTVSGATHTSYWIKQAAKTALEKWNQNLADTQSVSNSILAILSADDVDAAVANARLAYDGLSTELQSYISPSTYLVLAAAEEGIEAKKAEADLANAKVVLVRNSFTYNGSAFRPAVKVTSWSGNVLVEGVDYVVVYDNNVNAGTATSTVMATEGGAYIGSKAVTFTITPKPQTIKAAKTYKVKFAKAKKKRQTVAVKFIADGGGKITYAKAKNGKVSIAKNGKVTVAKGAKKGTYTLKVKVTAAAKGNYAETTSTVTLKVKVA